MKERILITGSSGFLGTYLINHLKNRADLHCLYRRHRPGIEGISTYCCDITNWDEVRAVFDIISPSVIIHAASLSDIEGCELNKDLAYKVNVLSTEYLSEISGKRGARFIYISTDNVFDGKRGLYTEEDIPDPVNYYGETKLMGEEKVRSFARRWVILRLSHLYGKGPGWRRVFFEEIIEKGKRYETVAVLREWRTFLWVEDCAAMISSIALRSDIEGVFHVAGSERMSRYDFAKKVFSHLGLDGSLIKVIDPDEYRGIAKRPVDVSLKGERLWMLSGIQPHGIEESLKMMGRDL